MWGAWFSQQYKTPKPPEERCVDGLPPDYWTCEGEVTLSYEPYLHKVFGDNHEVLMCELHRYESQRDADESILNRQNVKMPRYGE